MTRAEAAGVLHIARRMQDRMTMVLDECNMDEGSVVVRQIREANSDLEVLAQMANEALRP